MNPDIWIGELTVECSDHHLVSMALDDSLEPGAALRELDDLLLRRVRVGSTSPLDALTLTICPQGFYLRETRDLGGETVFRRYEFSGTQVRFERTVRFLAKHGAGLTGQARSGSFSSLRLVAMAPLGGAAPLHLDAKYGGISTTRRPTTH